jgi:hypothetical protein
MAARDDVKRAPEIARNHRPTSAKYASSIPDFTDKALLRHDIAGVSKQEMYQIKYLRLRAYGTTASFQRETARVEFAVGKSVDHTS